MDSSSIKDAKPLVNGAYSVKYRILEKERLERLLSEHNDNSKSLKERAQLLSKQTRQRRRALEEKKQAMARAEEERRKRTLEERRRQQMEAVARFRTAHPTRHRSSPKTSLLMDMIHTRPLRSHDQVLPIRSHDQVPPIRSHDQVLPIRSHDQHNIVLGRDVEVMPIFTQATPIFTPTTPTYTKDTPTLEEVLDTIRGNRVPDKVSSVESIVLSPEPITNQELATPPEPHPPDPPPVSNDSDSSTLSLQDSLESSDNETKPHPPKELLIEGAEDRAESIRVQSPVKGQERKGILKRGNGCGSGNRVRFSGTVSGCANAPPFIPRMRIPLHSNKHLTNHIRVPTNGITVHIPQVLTLPLNGGDTPTLLGATPPLITHDRDMWANIGAFAQQQARKPHPHPVKLWKRQPLLSPPTTHVNNITSEEQRLMESIEIINHKLRHLTETTHPTSNNNDRTLLVRTQPTKLKRIKQPVIKHRTYQM